MTDDQNCMLKGCKGTFFSEGFKVVNKLLTKTPISLLVGRAGEKKVGFDSQQGTSRCFAIVVYVCLLLLQQCSFGK